MTRIEELEQSIDETVEKFRLEINKFKAELENIKELAKESKKEGKWKPSINEAYWFRNSYGNSVSVRYVSTNEDIFRINNIPIFPTKEACEKYWHFMDTVKEKSYIFSNKEWNRYNLPKWYIRKIDKRICVDCIFSGNCYGSIYFKTKEDAEFIINNFSEELKEYWL